MQNKKMFEIILHKAAGAGPTTPTLVRPKILSCKFKALNFQSYGQTNNCHIEILFEWSDQSCTPSTAPVACRASYKPSKLGG